MRITHTQIRVLFFQLCKYYVFWSHHSRCYASFLVVEMIVEILLDTETIFDAEIIPSAEMPLEIAMSYK